MPVLCLHSASPFSLGKGKTLLLLLLLSPAAPATGKVLPRGMLSPGEGIGAGDSKAGLSIRESRGFPGHKQSSAGTPRAQPRRGAERRSPAASLAVRSICQQIPR